jgi:adenosylhomocysteine nucleosidase
MKISVITAMPVEFNIVARCLEPGVAMPVAGLTTLRCRTAGHDVMVIQSGMGFGNAARAAEMAVREERPDLLITTGFCGGITPDLQAGDVVVAKHIVIAGESGIEEVPVQFYGIGPTFVARQVAEGKRTVEGTFVSTRAITSKGRLAAILPGHYRTPVVEMESGAIAIVAAENNIPLLAIRAVSDCADEELGFSLDEFCDPALHRILPHRVLLTILRKPRIIPQLVRLSRSSRRAADGLEGACSRLFSLF